MHVPPRPSNSSSAAGAAGSAAASRQHEHEHASGQSTKEKADAIRADLGLDADLSIAQVAGEAAQQLGLEASVLTLSLKEKLDREYAELGWAPAEPG